MTDINNYDELSYADTSHPYFWTSALHLKSLDLLLNPSITLILTPKTRCYTVLYKLLCDCNTLPSSHDHPFHWCYTVNRKYLSKHHRWFWYISNELCGWVEEAWGRKPSWGGVEMRSVYGSLLVLKFSLLKRLTLIHYWNNVSQSNLEIFVTFVTRFFSIVFRFVLKKVEIFTRYIKDMIS